MGLDKNTLIASQVFLAALSAVCVFLSFPPFGQFYLAFFALAPLLFALRRSSLRQAFGLSFFFGYLHGIVVFRWLPGIEGVGYPVFLLLLAPIYSLYYAAFGLSYRLASGRIPQWAVLLSPASWITIEYTRASMFFLALPWNFLGHTQHAAPPLIGIADLAGVYGVSFLIVLVNEAVSRWLETILSRKQDISLSPFSNWSNLKIPTAFAVLALAFTVSWSLARGQADSRAEAVRVALLQPNILVKDGMTFQNRQRHLEIYSELSKSADTDKPDLIVWPASSLPDSISSRFVKAALWELVRGIDAKLLVGGSGAQKMSINSRVGKQYANTEFLLFPGTAPAVRYHKQKLVPFNEYLPLEGRVRWPRWITTLQTSFTPGKEYTLFSLGDARFGVPICWESLFPDLFRRFVRDGAHFMVNVTNEAYMGDTAGPWQTHAMNVFRAVENRVTLARVSATGISAFIGPDGKVLEEVEDDDGKVLFVEGILVRDIPLSTEKTFYTMHGDIFAWSMIAITAISLILLPWIKPLGEN